MKRLVLTFALLSAPGAAFAQSAGVYMPNAASSYGQDEFRGSDGSSCRTTMDGTKRLEVGTFASGGQQNNVVINNYSLPGYVSNPSQGNLGVYGRFTWTLDAPQKRMNCQLLYDLEVTKKELEVELLKQQISMAKQGVKEADLEIEDLKKKRKAGGKKMETAAGPPP